MNTTKIREIICKIFGHSGEWVMIQDIELYYCHRCKKLLDLELRKGVFEFKEFQE